MTTGRTHHERIDKRPAVVDRRGRLRDWELDTIIGAGHQKVVVTLTERASRLTHMQHMQQRTAEVLSQVLQIQWQPIKVMVLPYCRYRERNQAAPD
jgi:IS30 family transposase